MFNEYLFNSASGGLYNVSPRESRPHFILDGSYQVDSPDINRAYIIGRDAEGNPVFGEDEDAAEIGLVGERLAFKLHPSLATAALAAGAAEAALDKTRLQYCGFILVPPHCGVELWDVITIYDSLCAQEGQDYRVIGIRLQYDARQGRYQHELFLGGV